MILATGQTPRVPVFLIPVWIIAILGVVLTAIMTAQGIPKVRQSGRCHWQPMAVSAVVGLVGCVLFLFAIALLFVRSN
jgi:NADH:ubiquinone oxidoreductase subunit 6 (subunit J)